MPPEVDVSIRPGWFYHPAEDTKVASVDKLVEIYEQSVGRGANLLLNIPPDRRGLIPDVDAERLRELGQRIAATYKTDLARTAKAGADRTRGNADRFAAARVNDGDPATYWATDDGVSSGAVTLEWPSPVRLDRLVIQEAVTLGQRVESWTIDVEVDGALDHGRPGHDDWLQADRDVPASNHRPRAPDHRPGTRLPGHCGGGRLPCAPWEIEPRISRNYTDKRPYCSVCSVRSVASIRCKPIWYSEGSEFRRLHQDRLLLLLPRWGPRQTCAAHGSESAVRHPATTSTP